MKRIDEKSFRAMELPVVISGAGSKNYIQFQSIIDNSYHNEIRCYDSETKGWEKITEGTVPVVTADGSRMAYFTAGECGKTKLHLYCFQTGEDVVLGSFLRPSEVAFGPGGDKLVLTAAIALKHAPEDLPETETVLWIDRVKFKTDGVGLFDGTYRQVVLIDTNSGETQVIGEGKRDLSEPKILDDKTICYLGIPQKPDDSDDVHLYIRKLTGEVMVIPGPGGPVGHVSVSPDGNSLACIAHDNLYWEATNFKVYVFSFLTRTWKCITGDFDRSVGNYVINDTGYDRNRYTLEWSGDGRYIYSIITDGYASNLYCIDTESKKVVPVSDGKQVIFSYLKTDDDFLVCRSLENADAQIVRLSADGSEEIIWSGEIESSRYELSASVEFTYEDCDRIPRKALYYPPVGECKGMILNIHGGPHYCHGYDLSYDIQLLAARGFGTVLCNPAGSQGSGEMVARASYHDWGGKDYKELNACVDAAIEAFDLKDIRWAVMGGSYGGFMTNWMVGHTDRFACAVSERSTCNRYSQAGTSDCAFRYGMFEFDGAAWENPGHYMEHSPVSYVKNVHTPILLIHGDKDMNCPISQSEEWYSALRMEGKEAYLAVFPGQYHSLSGKGAPQSREDRYKLICWWLTKYLSRKG